MNAILRSFPIMLLISCFLLGCGKELTSDEHLSNADAFLEEKQFAEAIIELKNALRKDPSNARARATLGSIYFDRGFFRDADKELSRALGAGMDPTVVVPVQAQVLLGLGEFDRLDGLSDDGLDSESRSTLQAAQGVSKLYRDDLEGASELIETAVANKPSSTYAHVAAARLTTVKGQPEEAKKQLKAVFKAAPRYAPAWVLLGDIERSQGELEAAEKAYTKGIRLSRDSFEPLLNRVTIRIELGRFEDAEKDLTRLDRGYREAKDHAGVQFARGLIYIEAGKYAEAAESLKSASERSDIYPDTLYYLAVIYADRGQVQQALSSANQFLILKPEHAAGSKLAAKLELGRKNPRNAERLLLPVVAENENDVEALNLLANARLAQGNTGTAIELFSKIVELKPESKEAKTRLAAAYLAGRSEDLGLATLREVLEDDPSYHQADSMIVLYYLRQNQALKAIEAAQEYTQRSPGAASSVLLARTYLVNDQKDMAKEAFAQALALKPGHPDAANSLAEYALEEEDYDSARQYYQQVLEHHPEHMQTRLKVASTYAVQGNDEKMLSSLDATLAEYPRAMEPRLAKARYYIANGEPEKAIPLFEALSSEQKEHPDALNTLASFELETSRFNQAVGTISRLIDTSPNVAEYHFMKSRAYAGLGDKQRLSSELERTLTLNPNHFNAKLAQARLALLSDDLLVYEDRLADLKQVSPDNPDVVQLEIAFAYKSGDYEVAGDLLEGLFEQQPTTTNVVALATLKQTVNDLPGAVTLLQSWIEEHPKDVKVREKLAEIYGSIDQVSDVIEQCQEILKLEPDNIVALNNLAWHMLDQDPQQALDYAERAIALSPNSSPVLDTLAMAQLENNDLAEARESIDRALSGAPKSLDIRYHEAKIRAAEGDTGGAIVALNSLLASDEDFVERRKAEAFLNELK